MNSSWKCKVYFTFCKVRLTINGGFPSSQMLKTYRKTIIYYLETTIYVLYYMEKVYYIIDSNDVRFYRVEGGELVLCSLLGELSVLEIKVYLHALKVGFDFLEVYKFINNDLDYSEWQELSGSSSMRKTENLLWEFLGLVSDVEFIKL